jgi:hypothetical protein
VEQKIGERGRIMDIVEIMREYERMCSIGCGDCGLRQEFNRMDKSCEIFIRTKPEKVVEIIEKWA